VNKFLDLVLTGAVTGAIYSIMASGLVLTYRTSGIFNFAQGAVAFIVAYFYYQIHSAGIPIIPALILSAFVFAPLLGLVLDRVCLRRLAKAPVYARIVGTIGLLVALPAMAQWLVVEAGNGVFGLNLIGNKAITQGAPAPGIGPTPPHYFRFLRGVALNTDQLAVFAVGACTAVLLWYLLRRTRMGLEMRAVVDRDTLAGLRGINANRTSAAAWMLSMVLAGLGGVLIAPLFILDPTIFEFVVLGSLAAVVFGGLRSLPITFAGGLLIGVVQNLVAGYSTVLPKAIANLSGLQDSIPYLLVLLLGLILGRERGRQAGSASDERPPFDHRTGMSALHRRTPWVLFVVLVAGYALHWFPVSWMQANTTAQTAIAESIAIGIIFLSFVVVTGLGGMVSLAQATFVTAAGFGAGWALSKNWDINVPLIASHGQINFVWAVVVGTVIAAALGALIAWPATRLGPVYLAIWTLAAAFFIGFIPFDWNVIGQGDTGWAIRGPTLQFPGSGWIHDLITGQSGSFNFANIPDQIVLFFAVFGLIALLIHNLKRSPTGRSMLAVRSSEVAARASGIRSERTKILIFALAAGIAGVGGVMLSVFSFGASSSTAPAYEGLYWVVLAVLFGIRRPGGALLAGFAFAAGTPIFSWFATNVLPGGRVESLFGSAYFVPMLAGLGAITLARQPDGILSLSGDLRRSVKTGVAKVRRERIASAEASVHGGVVPMHEQIHGVTARSSDRAAQPSDGALIMTGIVAGYADVEILHGVSLKVLAGQVTALLGANGAGKSTLCSVAAGTLTPTVGCVFLEGESVTSKSTYLRSRSGLMLVPEAGGVFPGLSVEDNLSILLRTPDLRDRAYQRFPVLGDRRDQAAGLLSGGEQQMLSLAPVLADPPSVLIADEPTLGLAPLAAELVMSTILELRDLGTAVLLVEEHAQNALRVANTIAHIELGIIRWSGPRSEVDVEQLTAAYLGET
jgi:branched-subunit amino acid ABC-type transport system permease component/ABC-type branched-subunit amino acid transport system ATPase component